MPPDLLQLIAADGADPDMTALAIRVHRALVRRTGCRLTPGMVAALDRLGSDDGWWERMRIVAAPAAQVKSRAPLSLSDFGI